MSPLFNLALILVVLCVAYYFYIKNQKATMTTTTPSLISGGNMTITPVVSVNPISSNTTANIAPVGASMVPQHAVVGSS